MSDVDRFEQWKRDSAARQQSMYERYGDREWDAIPKCMKNADHIIRTKISLYVFNKNYEDLLETDEKKEKSAVDNALSKLLESLKTDEKEKRYTWEDAVSFSRRNDDFFLGCIYIDILLKDEKTWSTIPILKTKKRPHEGKTIFYELFSGRVYYGGWEDYEEDNKLPECWMCYPRDGTYRGESDLVLLDYCKSAAYRSFLPEVDVAVLIGSGVCSAVLAASTLFPPLFALEMLTLGALGGVAGTGIYAVSRSLYKLHDRDKHEQPCVLSDPDALREWLSVILNAGTALTAGGSAVAKAATFGKFSGASATAINLAATILRYTSVGVNGLGIVITIIDLVIKCVNNRLQTSDLKTFVSLCLLIANIVISTGQAERVIGFLARQPQRIGNAFNMVRNTTISTVKAIREYVSLDEILMVISGVDVAMYIFRNIGLPRTASTILFVYDRIRRCVRSQNGADVILALKDILLHIGQHFKQIIFEVQEAYDRVKKWFNDVRQKFEQTYRNNSWNPGTNSRQKFEQTYRNNSWNSGTNSRQNFEQTYRNNSWNPGTYSWKPGTSLQIADNVDRVLDALEPINHSNRNKEAKNIVNVINKVAREVDYSTDVEYLKITEAVCDRLRSMSKAELIVQRHDYRHDNATGYLSDEKKSELFGKILSQIEEPSGEMEIKEHFLRERQNFSAIGKNLIFSKPLYQSLKNTMHYFEETSEWFLLNQFAYEAARELLETDDLSKFLSYKMENIFCLTDYDKCLIFYYEIEKESGKVKGIIILDK